MSYIGPDELIFNTDEKNGIYGGGFNVKSIMMKNGISPIMTLNTDNIHGEPKKVSDLFDSLVVPNWVLSYHNKIGGKPVEKYENDSDEDDVIDDDLHDKLIGLVKEHDTQMKEKNEKIKGKNKGTKKNVKNKNKATKKVKSKK